MQPDQTTLLSHERGTLPDKFWYQLNEKSTTENWKEQHERMYADSEEEDSDSFHVTSEVKIK